MTSHNKMTRSLHMDGRIYASSDIYDFHFSWQVKKLIDNITPSPDRSGHEVLNAEKYHASFSESNFSQQRALNIECPSRVGVMLSFSYLFVTKFSI